METVMISLAIKMGLLGKMKEGSSSTVEELAEATNSESLLVGTSMTLISARKI